MKNTADISMEYSSMQKLANEISDTQERFETMCENLDSLASDLESQWKGGAQREFSEAYDDLKPKLESIGTVLEHYVTEIKKLVSNIEETDKASAAMFNQPGTPTF